MIHLDTSFLVDLLREAAQEKTGAAHQFLEEHRESPLAVSLFVACELESGAACSENRQRERGRVDAILRTLPTTLPGDGFARLYGDLFAELRKRGEAVSCMDLLIATAARLDDAGLVTRNVKDFERIPELRVLSY